MDENKQLRAQLPLRRHRAGEQQKVQLPGQGREPVRRRPGARVGLPHHGQVPVHRARRARPAEDRRLGPEQRDHLVGAPAQRRRVADPGLQGRVQGRVRGRRLEAGDRVPRQGDQVCTSSVLETFIYLYTFVCSSMHSLLSMIAGNDNADEI